MNVKVEQVIAVDGRFVRLAPFNEFPWEQVQKCPKRVLSYSGGFYLDDPQGFVAFDVTHLWRAKHP